MFKAPSSQTKFYTQFKTVTADTVRNNKSEERVYSSWFGKQRQKEQHQLTTSKVITHSTLPTTTITIENCQQSVLKYKQYDSNLHITLEYWKQHLQFDKAVVEDDEDDSSSSSIIDSTPLKEADMLSSACTTTVESTSSLQQQRVPTSAPGKVPATTTIEQPPMIATTTIREGQVQLLPDEITYQIFAQLNVFDLLECARVCPAWCSIIMVECPEFWEIIAPFLPNMDPTKMQLLLLPPPGCTSASLNGPMDIDLADSILSLLAYYSGKYNKTVEKLYFGDLVLTEQGTQFLAQVLHKSPSLKQVEFSDCNIPIHMVVNVILPACMKLERLSFSQSTPVDIRYTIPPSLRKETLLPGNTDYSSLTYLKLAFQHYDSFGDVSTGRLCGILRQCPSLVHLFLESAGAVHHGDCINRALDHCPRLKTLALTPDAEMPPTFTFNDIDNCDNDSTGLQHLVLVGRNIKISDKDRTRIFEQHHRTLKLVYLYYDTFTIIQSLQLLVEFGAPKLRELRISHEEIIYDDIAKWKKPKVIQDNPSFVEQLLVKLFSSSQYCPALEALELTQRLLDCPFYYYPEKKRFSFTSEWPFYRTNAPTSNKKFHFVLDINDTVLETIARNCSLLRHLIIKGLYSNSEDGWIKFVNTILDDTNDDKDRMGHDKNGGRLVDLAIQAEFDTAWEVIRKLTNVKRYRVYHYPSIPYSAPRPEQEIAMDQIMQERPGGKFKLVYVNYATSDDYWHDRRQHSSFER